jgi:hypothetical protein
VPKKSDGGRDPELEALLERARAARESMKDAAEVMKKLMDDIEQHRRRNEESVRRRLKP